MLVSTRIPLLVLVVGRALLKDSVLLVVAGAVVDESAEEELVVASGDVDDAVEEADLAELLLDSAVVAALVEWAWPPANTC